MARTRTVGEAVIILCAAGCTLQDEHVRLAIACNIAPPLGDDVSFPITIRVQSAMARTAVATQLASNNQPGGDATIQYSS
jgi:hypothetical protein